MPDEVRPRARIFSISASVRASSLRLDSREGANCSLAARTKSNISATRFSFDGSRTELMDESELTAELVSFEGDVLSVANDSRVVVGSGGIEARPVSLARSSSLTATDVLNLTASAALVVEVSSSIVATAGRVASPVVEGRDDSSGECTPRPRPTTVTAQPAALGPARLNHRRLQVVNANLFVLLQRQM